MEEQKDSEKNPFLEYILSIFKKEKVDEFLDSLNDEQKKFIYIFSSGFQSALGHNIVGIYDTEYVKQFNFTDDLINSLSLKLKEVCVKDINLNFIIVWQ